MLPGTAARILPYGVDCVRKSISIALGLFGVITLDTDVGMRSVTGDTQPLELRARSRDCPGFLQWLPVRAAVRASQAVHATIQLSEGAAPPSESALDLPPPPVGARARPLADNLSAGCDAALGHNFKMVP